MDQANAPQAALSGRPEPDNALFGTIELGRASEETRGVCGVFQDVIFNLFEPALERN